MHLGVSNYFTNVKFDCSLLLPQHICLVVYTEMNITILTLMTRVAL